MTATTTEQVVVMVFGFLGVIGVMERFDLLGGRRG
jgi:hypothetical protein